MKSLSPVRLFATPWTVAYQASQTMGFSRQEYWSGLPFPSPGDLPNPGIQPGSPTMLLPSEPPGKPLAHTILLMLTPWPWSHLVGESDPPKWPKVRKWGEEAPHGGDCARSTFRHMSASSCHVDGPTNCLGYSGDTPKVG